MFHGHLLLALCLRTQPAHEANSHIGPKSPTMKLLDGAEEFLVGVVIDKGTV